MSVETRAHQRVTKVVAEVVVTVVTCDRCGWRLPSNAPGAAYAETEMIGGHPAGGCSIFELLMGAAGAAQRGFHLCACCRADLLRWLKAGVAGERL